MNSLSNFGKIFGELGGLAQAPSHSPLDPAAQAAALLGAPPQLGLALLLRPLPEAQLVFRSAAQTPPPGRTPPPSAEHSLSSAGPSRGSPPGPWLRPRLAPGYGSTSTSSPSPGFSPPSTLLWLWLYPRSAFWALAFVTDLPGLWICPTPSPGPGSSSGTPRLDSALAPPPRVSVPPLWAWLRPFQPRFPSPGL